MRNLMELLLLGLSVIDSEQAASHRHNDRVQMLVD